MTPTEIISLRTEGACAYHKFRISQEDTDHLLTPPVNPYLACHEIQKAEYWEAGYLDASFNC